MNQHAATLLSLSLIAAPCANAAGDSFDPGSKILTMPSVSVGNASYGNVAVRLDNFALLGYTPIPLADGAVFDAPLVKLRIKGFSRGKPDSAGNSTVTFSIVITNKAANKIGIGRASLIANDITSILTDEKGEACNAKNISINGLMDGPAFLDTHPTKTVTLNDFEALEVGGSKEISVSSASACAFGGISVSFYSTLVVYDDNTQTWAQQPYSFVDQPMPLPYAAGGTVDNPSKCASAGLTLTSYNFISPGMTLSQINQIIGFNYDQNRVYTASTTTIYVWHDATKYIYVFFDESGLVISKQQVGL